MLSFLQYPFDCYSLGYVNFCFFVFVFTFSIWIKVSSPVFKGMQSKYWPKYQICLAVLLKDMKCQSRGCDNCWGIMVMFTKREIEEVSSEYNEKDVLIIRKSFLKYNFKILQCFLIFPLFPFLLIYNHFKCTYFTVFPRLFYHLLLPSFYSSFYFSAVW